MREIAIERGNMEGRVFAQWKIDVLEELLKTIVYGYGNVEPLVEVTNVKSWYDKNYDFHRLEFTSGGKRFSVRFHELFAVYVDGVEFCMGWTRSESEVLAMGIRSELKRAIDNCTNVGGAVTTPNTGSMYCDNNLPPRVDAGMLAKGRRSI